MIELGATVIEEVQIGQWRIKLPDGSEGIASITSKIRTIKTPFLEAGDKIIVGLRRKKGFYSLRVNKSPELKWKEK